MGKIIYKPHCSVCGVLIKDEVNYEEHTKGNAASIILPYKCPKCGEIFDCIEVTMPKQRE